MHVHTRSLPSLLTRCPLRYTALSIWPCVSYVTGSMAPAPYVPVLYRLFDIHSGPLVYELGHSSFSANKHHHHLSMMLLSPY